MARDQAGSHFELNSSLWPTAVGKIPAATSMLRSNALSTTAYGKATTGITERNHMVVMKACTIAGSSLIDSNMGSMKAWKWAWNRSLGVIWNYKHDAVVEAMIVVVTPRAINAPSGLLAAGRSARLLGFFMASSCFPALKLFTCAWR